MTINLTQPIPGRTVEETLANVISALRQQQIELEHYLSHLDTTSLVSYQQAALTQGPSQWEDVATNFNKRNDRNQVIPSNPVVANDGTAIDHTNNTDGSVNISFEWAFEGTGPAYDVDGFIVYVYASNSSDPYTFGTYLGLESKNYVPAAARGYIIEGVPADQYYTFGVRAFRNVDQDIEASGILNSNIIKSTFAEENPCKPEDEVAFAGSIAATIGGATKSASDIIGFIDTDYPADQVIVNGQIAQKKRVFLTTPTPPYDTGDLWCPGSTGEFMVCTTAKSSEEDYSPSDWESASDSVRLGTKYNLNSISIVDGFKSEDTGGNYTQMNAGGLKHHQKTIATLSGALTDVATSLTVSSDVFPADANVPFFIRIDNEIIKVNTKSGTSFTSISRGQMGTTSAAHNSGTEVLLTKDYFYLMEIDRVSTIGSASHSSSPWWSEANVLSYVPPVTVQLPDEYKGKQFKIFAEGRLSNSNAAALRRLSIDMDGSYYERGDFIVEVQDIDYVNASFVIKAYMWAKISYNYGSNTQEECSGLDITYTVTA